MNRQYLFLGGAPKCGTSAIFDVLNNHPNIHGSTPKETYYFLPKAHPLQDVKENVHEEGVDGFRKFFSPADSDEKWSLEGTTHTLFFPETVKSTNTLGQTKWIFVLRNPIERLRSSFEYTLNNLSKFKQEISFDTYIKLVLSNREHELQNYLMESPSLYVLQRDLMYGRYADYIKEYIHQAGKDNVRVIIYEEYVERGTEIIDSIFSWLGLDSHRVTDTRAVKNKTQGIRHKGLHRFVSRIATAVPSGALKKAIKSTYLRIQSSGAKRVTISPEVRKELLQYYSESINQLESVLGKNLDAWKK